MIICIISLLIIVVLNTKDNFMWKFNAITFARSTSMTVTTMTLIFNVWWQSTVVIQKINKYYNDIITVWVCECVVYI